MFWIFNIFADGSSNSHFLTEDAQVCMHNAIQLMDVSMKQVIDGSVTIERFRLIHQHKEQFLSFCAIVMRKSHDPKDTPLVDDDQALTLHIQEALKNRHDEVAALDEKRVLIQIFNHQCNMLQPNCHGMYHLLSTPVLIHGGLLYIAFCPSVT